MKILVAIQSSENAKKLGRTTLRWAARAGYNFRIFIPDEGQREDYEAAIADANYNYYLDLPPSVIEVGDPKAYAKKQGFDLLILLPDNLNKWRKNHTLDQNVLDYAGEVGEARTRFGKQPDKKQEQFENGAVMMRV